MRLDEAAYETARRNLTGACRIEAAAFVVGVRGYLASNPEKEAVRSDLTAEAIRLTRLVRALMPADGEVAGLLALMLLTEARRAARVSASGELVTLDEQDRGAWDRELIAEGHALVRARLASGQAPGRYQILAAINAVHTDARDFRDTDCRRSSRSTTSWSASTPRRSCGSTGRSRSPSSTARRLGQSEESRAAYDRAIGLAGNTAETAYLIRRRNQLAGP